MTQRDRILGCIVGGAVGDAFGVPYEGLAPPISIDTSQPWRVSDDTQLTLATCEAITSIGHVDVASIASSLRRLFLTGSIRGIGASTLKALSELAHGGHWALVGASGERAAGNGAAMRTAPLAFLLDPSVAGQRQTIADVCRITHRNDEAIAGAIAVTAAVRLAYSEEWSGTDDLLTQVANWIPDSLTRDRLVELARSSGNVNIHCVAERYGTSGFAADTVPLALFAAERVARTGFAGMLRELILCGGDTDTVASIAGQIAGTLIGVAQLPDNMIENLDERDYIMETASCFAHSIL